MMGNNNLSEIRRDLRDLLGKLPGGPKAWFERELQIAQRQPGRDVETLKLLQSALQKPVRRRRPRRTKTTESR